MDVVLNDIVTITISDLAYGGRGVGKVNGFVIFVQGTVPGDVIRARIIKRKSNHAIAQLVDIQTPSPLRLTPPCSHFDECGGCTWQNITYKHQLAFKEQILKTTLEHLGALKDIAVKPIIPSPEIWHYRNKMDFTFSADSNGCPTLGFHKEGSYLDIIDIKRCFIHPKIFNTILQIVREEVNRQQLISYNPQTHEGFLRHLIVREGKHTGNIMVTLLSTSGDTLAIEPLVAALCHHVPTMTSLVWGVNAGVADVAGLDRIAYQYGTSQIEEHLDSLRFLVSPSSFFQANTLAAQQLYTVAREMADLSKQDVLLDAYCGIGPISIFCSDSVKAVIGIETAVDAIWDARQNAALNRVTNCTFLTGEVRKVLPTALSSVADSITRIIVDPPRSGMDKKTLRHLLELKAPVVVYISCNPTTLARDLGAIRNAGYRIEAIQPVDMFPHTYHIETVVKFVL
jgi:23S rRNA (uracil1939-C5)-methyltransferase